jgi:hypothetical protein
MKNVLLPLALLILASCASTSEPAMNGMWDFTMSSPFGVDANVSLAVSGTTLSGQFDLGGGRILAIEEGSINGNTISFTLKRDGAAMSYSMTGTLDKDSIAGTASALGAEVPWTMARGS